VEAVNAVKAGAADFASKPLDAAELQFSIQRAIASRTGAEDEPPPASMYGVARIIGSSDPMTEVLTLVKRAATAMIWQGWKRSVRPLMTGIVEWRANSSTISWPKVRIITPSQ
jgi:hypothetical protein